MYMNRYLYIYVNIYIYISFIIYTRNGRTVLRLLVDGGRGLIMDPHSFTPQNVGIKHLKMRWFTETDCQ